MTEKKEFNLIIEVMRIFSILGVILIHTSTRTIEFYKFDLNIIPITVFFNQISRYAVPLFFIISGFALNISFKINESYFIYVKKRVNKIITPYIFWSIIYYFFIYWRNRDVNFIRSLLLGNASYQLYFIPSLLILYFIFPVLNRLIDKYKLKLLLVVLIIELVLVYYDYYISNFKLIDPLRISILNIFPFIFGIYFSKNVSSLLEFFSKYKYLFLTSVAILIVSIFREGYFGYIDTNNYLYLYSQWRPSVLLYSIILFGLIYLFFDKRFANNRNIKSISSLSFLVYFIHVIILEAFYYINPKIADNSIIYFIFVTVASFGISAFIQKIPNLKTLTG
jgi:surface polysaccharide O-acyltransferase-like enzyme